jgi:hypothetical protein
VIGNWIAFFISLQYSTSITLYSGAKFEFISGRKKAPVLQEFFVLEYEWSIFNFLIVFVLYHKESSESLYLPEKGGSCFCLFDAAFSSQSKVVSNAFRPFGKKCFSVKIWNISI